MIARELVIDIADRADLKACGQELRGSPIEMAIDAVLVLSARIDEIVGRADYDGNLMSSLLIEIGVAGAGVDRSMSDAQGGKLLGIVKADGNVAGEICSWRLFRTPNSNAASRSDKGRQPEGAKSLRLAEGELPPGPIADFPKADVVLGPTKAPMSPTPAREHRRREHVTRIEILKVDPAVDARLNAAAPYELDVLPGADEVVIVEVKTDQPGTAGTAARLP